MGSSEICGGLGGGKPRRWHLSGGQHTQQTCRSIGREERSDLDGVAPLARKHRVKDDPLNKPYFGYDGQPIQWAVPGVVELADLYRISEYMLLLFETPSGFAVFRFCGSLINPPKSLEDIWFNFTDSERAKWVVLLMEFQTFEDKSGAINQNTGVSERLAEMIRTWLPGQKLAVGKPEYKEIIEERLKIECLYNQRVMEVMWGIQNCMPSLVPMEKSQLAKEDRFLSKGVQEVLKRYGRNVKPEMVNEQIVATASALSACDSVEKEYSLVLHKAGVVINDVSGISCEGWSLLEIATALKMIWKPEEVGSSSLVSKDEALRLVNDASKYEALMNKYVCFRAYQEMLKAHVVRTSKKELLKSLVEGLKKP